ncbi:hypothetical protein P0L94_16865 [Microbacter sp. GSS18]|nr:hypothetical protein P0L94_16865 [Microbacter sp. GSS18]
MTVALASVLTAVLALLAVFQIALVFGAPLGRFAWGGQHLVLPGRLRIGSAVTVLVYALIALIAWDRAGVIDIFGDAFSQIAMWVIFAYFAFGIVVNAVSRSRPERFTMVPVSIVLAAVSFFIALG